MHAENIHMRWKRQIRGASRKLAFNLSVRKGKKRCVLTPGLHAQWNVLRILSKTRTKAEDLTFVSLLVSFSQLYVEQHPLVLVHMYLPAAVLALAVPLGPVWGEDHATWTREVAPTLCCRERQ